MLVKIRKKQQIFFTALLQKADQWFCRDADLGKVVTADGTCSMQNHDQYRIARQIRIYCFFAIREEQIFEPELLLGDAQSFQQFRSLCQFPLAVMYGDIHIRDIQRSFLTMDGVPESLV